MERRDALPGLALAGGPAVGAEPVGEDGERPEKKILFAAIGGAERASGTKGAMEGCHFNTESNSEAATCINWKN